MKVLVVQTAFLGDAILATALLESLHASQPEWQLDVLVRLGNEGLFAGHPFVHNVLTWNKQQEKQRNLFRVIRQVRGERYHLLVNLQRHPNTALLTVLSGARNTVGFASNPLSWLYNRRIPHTMDGRHEVERNHMLISHVDGSEPSAPRLYPTPDDHTTVAPYQTVPYVCIAPTSVWFTKQWPAEKWVDLIRLINMPVWLLGSNADAPACDAIVHKVQRSDVQSLAGRLTILQSAALIAGARMTFANDSAVLHVASAMNAPITAVFCSTVPEFGFGPLSDASVVVQTDGLDCRPCGIHGRTACPRQHFGCAEAITPSRVMEAAQSLVELSSAKR